MKIRPSVISLLFVVASTLAAAQGGGAGTGAGGGAGGSNGSGAGPSGADVLGGGGNNPSAGGRMSAPGTGTGASGSMTHSNPMKKSPHKSAKKPTTGTSPDSNDPSSQTKGGQ
ncbi:hypothetical protein PQR75_40560 [Paraburkholderia fungorum]|uniref:hypothetical protein n=1 Tax=Paraburkholderia fungorum TaxID=134537 RepID=UPI0038B84BCE